MSDDPICGECNEPIRCDGETATGEQLHYGCVRHRQAGKPDTPSLVLTSAGDGGLRWAPIPMLLWCPACGERHIDEGEFATKPHHTHACQHCGMVWRPAIVATVGVGFLPGFKNEAS